MVPVTTGNIAQAAFGKGTPILAADEPPPMRTARPDGGSAFVFICDHAGRKIPRALGSLGLGEEDLGRHIAWDLGAAAVTEWLSGELDATAVFQNYSRLVIDCNRRPDVANAIPEISEETPIPGNMALGDSGRQARIDEIFTPYHDHLSRILDGRAERNRDTVLVSIHSFTPVFKGRRRPWDFALVYNRDPRLSRIVQDLLKADGDLHIGDNEPYFLSDKTDYTLPVHGEQRRLPHSQFEIRQDLIETPEQQARWAGRLSETLKHTLEIFNRDNG